VRRRPITGRERASIWREGDGLVSRVICAAPGLLVDVVVVVLVDAARAGWTGRMVVVMVERRNATVVVVVAVLKSLRNCRVGVLSSFGSSGFVWVLGTLVVGRVKAVVSERMARQWQMLHSILMLIQVCDNRRRGCFAVAVWMLAEESHCFSGFSLGSY